MKLTIRNLTITQDGEALLDGVGYTFYQGSAYCINADDERKRAFFDSIACGAGYESGKIELVLGGKNCMTPAMVSRFGEEPVFPEFLTIREFLKYYIDMNCRNILQPQPVDEYLKMAELSKVRADRLLGDFTMEERIRLQYLCFLISRPPVLIIDSIKNISNVDFLKSIKSYIDHIKQDGIVLFGCTDESISVFLRDEEVTIEDGCMRGGR